MPEPPAPASVIGVFAAWNVSEDLFTGEGNPVIGANDIHKFVMIANPSRFYHVIDTISRMTGYLYRGKDWDPAARQPSRATIEWVSQPSFCEMRSCSEFATWRISYGSQAVEFCSSHALSTMRNRRLWLRK